MNSHAIGQFPQVRFSKDRKWLFNPVLKQRLANRPEERVRLQYVDFLLQQTGVSSNRVGFESPVEAAGAENKLRADLVIYNRGMQPFALIECKSEKIKLTEKTAQQAARYNQDLNAEFVMITNGLTDYWYRIADRSPQPLNTPPFQLKDTSETKKPFDYWHTRGFLSSSISEEIRPSVVRFLLNHFSIEKLSRIRYLQPPGELTGIPLDHYYSVSSLNENISLALTLLRTASDETIFAAILNRNKKLSGIFWFKLTHLLSQPDSVTGTLITPAEIKELAVPAFIQHRFIKSADQIPGSFKNLLINFFD